MSFSCPLWMEVVKCESIFSNIWLRFCYEYETTFESDINKRENNQCSFVDNFCREMPIRAFQQSPSRSPGLLLRPHWKSHFRAKFQKKDLLSSLLQIPNERRKLRFLDIFLLSPVLGLAPVLPFLLSSHQWDLQSPVLLVINKQQHKQSPPDHKQTLTLTSTKSSSTSTKLVRPASKMLVSVLFLWLRQIK